MKEYKPCLIKFLITFMLSLLLQVCGAEPDPSSVGNCTLSCASAKIAAHDARIRFFGTNALSVACQGAGSGVNYPGSIPIQFVIEQAQPAKLPAATLPGETAPTPLVPDVGIPAPSVSFEASILSGIMGPSNPDDDSAKYKGIVTSQSEWCTDSCGVGIIEVVPLCFGTSNVVTLQIHSGSAVGVSTISVGP